ncbi:hypothetical protein [Streptomyces sp. NPDC059176]|uniref:hypothetical protein n=1 Tax=unclassified Streptomyces TaxID=2593676 RepID=UPI00368C738E
MDLQRVKDDLYGLLPEEFTAARGRLAAAARTAGDRELAGRISSLRRPTLSAWASNLLVRARPDRVNGLLRLGEGLREAHQGLDREQLRTLSAQQHRLVGALAREVAELAADAGHALGDPARREVEGTLRAVLADPRAAEAWATGHLDRPLSPPVGFTAAAVSGAGRRAAPPVRVPSAPAGGDAAPTARGEQAERRRAEEQRRLLAAAVRDADEAEEQARECADRLRTAESERARAEEALRRAEERARALAAELKKVHDLQHTARSALDDATARVSEATEEAVRARRSARAARGRADRIASDAGA